MTKEITVREGDIVCHGFRLTPSGLVPVGEPKFEDWEMCGSWLSTVDKSVQFWLGDWINYGEFAYGEKYAQALDVTEYSYGYLRQVAYVASAIGPSDRSNVLGFRHHYEVAQLNKKDQRRLLREAEDGNWSVQELRNEVRRMKGKATGKLMVEVSVLEADTGMVVASQRQIPFDENIVVDITESDTFSLRGSLTFTRSDNGREDEKKKHGFFGLGKRKAA